jgi:hypothetical protein
MLGFILICFALLLGFIRGCSFPQVLSYFVQALTDPTTLQLLGVITLIEMLTIFLELTGSLNRILAALRKVIDDPRILIALVPSFLGVFPVPGGAMLSAPMVRIYGEEIGFDADQKSSTNLFFRHVWDLVIPFKPHIILAASVANIPLFTLIGWNLPVSIATLFVGYWLLIGRYPRPDITHMTLPDEAKPGLPLWIEVAPLLLPLVISLGFGISFFYSMTIGLLFGLITQKVSIPMMKRMVREGIRPKLLLLLASVMIFKNGIGKHRCREDRRHNLHHLWHLPGNPGLHLTAGRGYVKWIGGGRRWSPVPFASGDDSGRKTGTPVPHRHDDGKQRRATYFPNPRLHGGGERIFRGQSETGVQDESSSSIVQASGCVDFCLDFVPLLVLKSIA